MRKRGDEEMMTGGRDEEVGDCGRKVLRGPVIEGNVVFIGEVGAETKE